MRPQTEQELVDAIQALRAEGRCAVVVGGGTLVDVADAGTSCERLDTTGLWGFSGYEPEDLTCTVRAGVTLDELSHELGPQGQFLPVWHPAAERATLGGLVAFGWTGLGRRLYGTLRDRVLEVVVVTGEGKLVRGGGKVVKNVTGFDLPRLFCGSLGTLGVIVELTLKVHPGPETLHAVRRDGPDPGSLALALAAAVERVRSPVEAILRNRGDGWVGYAFAPGPGRDAELVLQGFDGSEADPDASFASVASDPVMAPAVGGLPEGALAVRVSVPPARILELAPLLTSSDRAVVDVAAGTAWASLASEAMVETLRAFAEGADGSCVLLHAPEQMRARLGTWGSPPSGVEIMRRLKHSFDPDGVLAPGRYVV